MSEKTKLKIGEFSKLMQVTVKTLRHYEQMGLLIPYEVDKWTGYRYYTIEQMQRLNAIRELKGMGFSLEEIKDLYDDEYHEPSISQINAKLTECNRQIRTLLRRRPAPTTASMSHTPRHSSILRKRDTRLPDIQEQCMSMEHGIRKTLRNGCQSFRFR